MTERASQSTFTTLPQSLTRLSQQVAAETDPLSALSQLVHSVRQELDIDRAGVFAYDRHFRSLDHLAGIDRSGNPEFEVSCVPVTSERWPMLQVARRELPYYFSQNAPADYPDRNLGAGITSLAVVPVVAGGELVGMLCVDNCLTGRPLPERVLEPLFLYASLAAVPLFARYSRLEQEREDTLRRAICGDMLFTISGGKISLCTRDQVLEEWPQLEPAVSIREPSDVRQVREVVHHVTQQSGMEEDRAGDFALCVSEAATNALLHGNGGIAAIAAQNGCVRARIEDRGAGISLDQLPSATLVKGWSSKRSMGLGFTVMVETADRIFLNTGAAGTTVILEMGVTAPKADSLFDPMQWGEGIEL